MCWPLKIVANTPVGANRLKNIRKFRVWVLRLTFPVKWAGKLPQNLQLKITGIIELLKA
jgi:hypothetical protein